MDDHLIKIFQMQIWTQCRFAAIALDDFKVQLADADAARERAQPRYAKLATLDRGELTAAAYGIAMEWPVRTWAPIQAFLTAVANISKACWGQKGEFADVRAELRASLEVKDDSPIRPTTMRNHFDHFDEKLDQWWAKSTNHNYLDLSFGDMAVAVGGEGISQINKFRSFDPATGNLVFWGLSYHLPTVEKELARIERLALIACSK